MFDMYTALDIINGFSLPIQLYASSPNSSLDKRIQNKAHTAFTFSNIEQAIIDEDIIVPLYGPFAGYKYAMILVNEMPIELIATAKEKYKEIQFSRMISYIPKMMMYNY